MLDVTKEARPAFGKERLYEATVDSYSLKMYDRKTREPLDVVAIIPSHAPDLEALVKMVPQALAGELARLAAWRALGFEASPPEGFDT